MMQIKVGMDGKSSANAKARGEGTAILEEAKSSTSPLSVL